MDDAAPSVEVVVDPSRGPLLVKRATSGPGRARLAHEASVLATARRSGVVELVAHHDASEEARLVTRWIGPHTLATSGPLPVEQAAGVVAALAETVAELHALGVVHTRLTADHVILGPGGAPVLCGFGDAGGPSRCSPADDVADLGALLTALVACSGSDVEPIPEGYRRFGRRRWAGYDRRTLLTLADQAAADEHTARPTARSLAQAIRTAVPDAVLPPPPTTSGGGEAPPPPGLGANSAPAAPERPAPPLLVRASSAQRSVPPGPVPAVLVAVPVAPPNLGSPPAGATDPLPRRFHRALPLLAAVVGAALVLVGFREVVADPATPDPPAEDRALPPIPAPSPPRPSDRPASTSTSGPPTTSPPSTSPPAPAPPPTPPGCAAVGAPAADVDGDGCAEAVVVHGERVVVGGVTYEVGRAGDLVSVGDWDCDGRATPALLRTATGEVFVFDGWATPGHDLTVAPLTVVSEATAVAGRDRNGDGCPELTVRRAGGGDTVISVGGA